MVVKWTVIVWVGLFVLSHLCAFGPDWVKKIGERRLMPLWYLMTLLLALGAVALWFTRLLGNVLLERVSKIGSASR